MQTNINPPLPDNFTLIASKTTLGSITVLISVINARNSNKLVLDLKGKDLQSGSMKEKMKDIKRKVFLF